MTTQAVWQLIQQTTGTFTPHYQKEMGDLLRESNLRGGDWQRTFLAYGVDPQPLTLELVHQLAPYDNIDHQREQFQETIERGFLQTIATDSYQLTEQGRNTMTQFYATASSAIADLKLLAEGQMQQLVDLLQRIVTATEAADIDKPFFLMSRRSDPGTKAPAPIRIDQYLTDLLRYRDDAHLAAWRAHDVCGYAWEGFSDIWQDGAKTAVTLAENHTNRHITAEQYAAGLDNLVERGWLSKQGDLYDITEKGKSLRNHAEDETNQHFFTGWSALTSDEQATLVTLLQKTHQQLRREAMKKAWTCADGILGGTAPLYADATRALMAENGLDKPGMFFVMWQGLAMAPHPISPDNLRRRFPYMNPKVYEERTANAAEIGLLEATVVSGEYSITAQGRAAYRTVDGAFTAALAQMELLPEERLARLNDLLSGIVRRSAEPTPKIEKWSLLNNIKNRRDGNKHPLVQLDEYLDELNAHRDDVHLAAVSPHNLSGSTLEAFTFLWHGDADTGATLQEKLSFRGYDEAHYTAVLQELASKGWAKEQDNKFALTAEGESVRETIEQKTDDLFFAAWEPLNDGEVQALVGILNQLQRNIEMLVAEKTAAPAT